MTMIASIHGRMGNDPTERFTKSGAAMTVANVAVDVTGKGGEPQTLWVGLLAFNAGAEALARSAKGEMVVAMGRLTRGTYTPANGEPRESWSMLCDNVIVAKSARPSGKKSPGQGQGQ